MTDRLERFMMFLRHVHAHGQRDAAERLEYASGTGLVASVMDDVFFLSLDDGWMGFARRAYSFSAVACMAAVVLFLVSGTMGHSVLVERALSGLLEDPAGLFALYYLEF